MPIYDVTCDECMIIKQDVMFKMNETPNVKCPSCGKLMKKRVHPLNFKLSYNNKTDVCDWDGNTSQYWKSYKEAKAQGQNVRPADEE